MSNETSPAPDDDSTGGDGTTEEKYCLSCGAGIVPDAEICPECGVSQAKLPSSGGEGRSADEKYCTSCGDVVNRDAEICPECGVRQTVGTSPGGDSDKDQVAAGLLAILLGGVGAHKFYLDETKMGVVYLCFSWTFIPAIIGLIEGIMYLTKSEEEFQRKYVDS